MYICPVWIVFPTVGLCLFQEYWLSYHFSRCSSQNFSNSSGSISAFLELITAKRVATSLTIQTGTPIMAANFLGFAKAFLQTFPVVVVPEKYAICETHTVG